MLRLHTSQLYEMFRSSSSGTQGNSSISVRRASSSGFGVPGSLHPPSGDFGSAMKESVETWMKEIPMLSPPKIVWFMIAARGSSLLGDPLFVSDARVFVESDVERLPATVVLGAR